MSEISMMIIKDELPNNSKLLITEQYSKLKYHILIGNKVLTKR